jgi:hypothetical protein
VEFPPDAAWCSDAEDSDDDNAAIHWAIYEASSPKKATAVACGKPRWADLEDSEGDISSPETQAQDRSDISSTPISTDTSSQGPKRLPQVAISTRTEVAASVAAAALEAATVCPATPEEADAVKPRKKQRGKRGGANHKDKSKAATQRTDAAATPGQSLDKKMPREDVYDAATWDSWSWRQDYTRGGGRDWQKSNGWKDNKSTNRAACAAADGYKASGAWKQYAEAAAESTKKHQCQFHVGIEDDKKFGVVRRLLGSHGVQVKRIAEESNAKLRLRGRGSKFLEGQEQEESADPLMMCVSAPDKESYDIAIKLVREHLEQIYSAYREHCRKTGLVVKDLCIDMHEGRRDGSY